MTSSSAPLVRVDVGSRGRWDVLAHEADAPVSCETFDDACQIAHWRAERLAPCELVIRDAYHHVVWREFVAEPEAEHDASPGTGPDRPNRRRRG